MNIKSIQINHQLDATISPVYYLTFIFNSTCFGRLHAHHLEHNNCSSSLWFYLRSVVIAVLLVVVGPTDREEGAFTQKHVGDAPLIFTYSSYCAFGWGNKTEYTVLKIRIGHLKLWHQFINHKICVLLFAKTSVLNNYRLPN
jgi:hypothetical protein